jgi:O-antigen ligase/tetratricopeptide (TPR) repeat protein
MIETNNLSNWIFIFLFLLAPFIPPFGAIDLIGPQLLYLSVVTFISSLYLFVYRLNSTTRFYKSKITIVFFLFIFWCLLTVINSFNPTEGFITFFRTLLMGFYLVNLSNHFIQVKIKFHQLAILFSLLLLIDVIEIFISFISIYNYNSPPNRSNELVGFTSNLNVLGFSLLFRIPFILFLVINSTNWIYRLLSILLFCLAQFFLITSGSRGAILSLILLISLFTLYHLVYNKKKRFVAFSILVGVIATFGIHSLLFENGNKVTDRLETLGAQELKLDKSIEERLTWLSAAFEGIMDKPLMGHGIGNWKVVGNKYVTDYITQYTVPKHVHNDFVQTFAEVGVFGFLFYCFFFVLIILKIFKSKKTIDKQNFGFLVLLFSVLAFLIDSNLNFPIHRPTPIFNLIFLVAYVVSINPKRVINKNYHKVLSPLILIGTFLTFGSSYKLYNGTVDEVEFFDRVGHNRGFETPLDKIDQLNHSYPNITYTTVPIISIKAIYYWKNKRINEAKQMLRAGNKINPYLSVSEVNLANIFLEEGKMDSAYHYAKKAFYNLKNNGRHANIFQMVLAKTNNLEELDSVFEITKGQKIQEVYRNHLHIISYLKINDSFTNRDREIAKEARRLFPYNKVIRRADKIIQNGGDLIASANELDTKAKNLFSQKKYHEAIVKWNEAKKILPVESSYYLNIAQSQILLGDFESSYAELDSIGALNIKKGDGKWEFLRAMSDLSTNKTSSACQYLLAAYRLGKVKETLPVIRQLKCQSL